MATRGVVCVDPDEEARTGVVELLAAELEDQDVRFETAGSLATAEELLDAGTAAVITEYELPDGTGLDVVLAAREACPDAGCILYTDVDPDAIDTDQLQDTVTEYVGKGSVFGTERLAQLVRTTIERKTQATYPVPQDELDRLSALQSYHLDDPDLVQSLDRITRTAADHFDVSTASINVIDEHSQEFLACHGNAEEWGLMDREDSICTFTILEDQGVMVVEDVRTDPRFESRSEALVDLGIVSYMGANLVTPAGLVVGPLCVYDDEPRVFDGEDAEFLKNLADLAMEIIELHARIETQEPDVGVQR